MRLQFAVLTPKVGNNSVMFLQGARKFSQQSFQRTVVLKKMVLEKDFHSERLQKSLKHMTHCHYRWLLSVATQLDPVAGDTT